MSGESQSSREAVPDPSDSLPNTANPIPSRSASTASDVESPRPLSVAVWPLSTAELATALATTLNRLSPSRAGIVTDQLRTVLRSEAADRLIVRAAAAEPARLENAVLAITLLPDSGDTATVLHLDWVQPPKISSIPPTSGIPDSPEQTESGTAATATTVGRTAETIEPHKNQIAQSLRQELVTTIADRGMRFIQWATDPVAPAPEDAAKTHPVPANRWPETFQFSQIGTLEYLALDCDDNGQWNTTADTDKENTSAAPLTLESLDHDDAAQRDLFEKVVAQTYVDSLDCPPLENFRTVQEIIAGYRNAAAFAPDLWFIARESTETTNNPSTNNASTSDASTDQEPANVGCLILARHANSHHESDEESNPSAVIELVYMGIAPEHRGRGYGEALMRKLIDICQHHSAERLILAVDRDNHPALAAYNSIGMQPLFRETVWGHKVPSPPQG
ncbi:GNAT family N-acetyltransferase [Rhodopirellula sallentina]|uniref:Nourseothricin acetyltransferase n=1 Tax=Rhodopirellula sallentina SM41 TaxID=1263870 RepID=M5U916_9BACT|nr:GNAT family N-acetyltransferase [Rhodopirellula sallentina]EMI54351.1 nourseothricin acetyltransferase [Rhodopirellula sallentina SM41]